MFILAIPILMCIGAVCWLMMSRRFVPRSAAQAFFVQRGFGILSSVSEWMFSSVSGASDDEPAYNGCAAFAVTLSFGHRRGAIPRSRRVAHDCKSRKLALQTIRQCHTIVSPQERGFHDAAACHGSVAAHRPTRIASNVRRRVGRP